MRKNFGNKRTQKSFPLCSSDLLGLLRNQNNTPHLRLTIISCASEHLSRFRTYRNFGEPIGNNTQIMADKDEGVSCIENSSSVLTLI